MTSVGSRITSLPARGRASGERVADDVVHVSARPARSACRRGAGGAPSRRAPTRDIRPCLPRLAAGRSRPCGVRSTRCSSPLIPAAASPAAPGPGSVTSTPSSRRHRERAVANRSLVLGQARRSSRSSRRPVEEVARDRRAPRAPARARSPAPRRSRRRSGARPASRQRHRVDRVPGRAPQLAGEVDEPGTGQARPGVRAVAGPHVDGVAVDHRADRVAAVQVVERHVDRRRGATAHVDQPAVGVREPGAAQAPRRRTPRAPPSRCSCRSARPASRRRPRGRSARGPPRSRQGCEQADRADRLLRHLGCRPGRRAPRRRSTGRGCRSS